MKIKKNESKYRIDVKGGMIKMIQFVVFNVGIATVSYALGYYDGNRYTVKPEKEWVKDDKWTLPISEK